MNGGGCQSQPTTNSEPVSSPATLWPVLPDFTSTHMSAFSVHELQLYLSAIRSSLPTH